MTFQTFPGSVRTREKAFTRIDNPPK